MDDLTEHSLAIIRQSSAAAVDFEQAGARHLINARGIGAAARSVIEHNVADRLAASQCVVCSEDAYPGKQGGGFNLGHRAYLPNASGLGTDTPIGASRSATQALKWEMPKMSLAGKTAFVSGAGRNIGRAVALELARRGCSLALNGASDERACEETAQAARRSAGVDAMVYMGDIGQPHVVREMSARFLSRFSSVDILVNNAAIRPHTPFLELLDEDWHRVLDVDLNAAFYFCRAFVPGMAERDWGRIVNLTGMNAIRGYDQLAPVSAAKHGLWGLTKALAKEFGPKGITCNAVSPGTIRSERPDPEATERQAKLAASIPLRRLGEPEDIAALVGFLCSNEGGFINGQMIASNGGVET